MARTSQVLYDAIVIGAGFSGIRSLWELRKLGLSVTCFEAASDVGGAWYWNRYPGARTDSEAWVYNLNFSPGLKDVWEFSERYPSQLENQRNLSNVVDRYNLRELIQFNVRVASAHFCDNGNFWKITLAQGASFTSRYFVPATGGLSQGRDLPFPGLAKFKGERYVAAEWPDREVTFQGKRIAVVGTGATGVQIIPKIAPVAKSLTVFQRTPNYVLPARNYNIDEYELQEIRQNYRATFDKAGRHDFGLAMNTPKRSIDEVPGADNIRAIMDSGWESGGFHFQFETFGDLISNQESNDVASEYLRSKIRAIVQNPKTAELLCPKYPFLSKRPPCGHFYYETYNRPHVELVDISGDDIDMCEDGICTQSGQRYTFDMIIFGVGFDVGTGALTAMDIRGSGGKSLKETWSQRLTTFGGVLVPGFPNMFMIGGPHIPFGNMPVVIDMNVGWVGKAVSYLEANNLARMDVGQAAVEEWGRQVDNAFHKTILAESAKANHAWFVRANVSGKPDVVLFYFGGIPNWYAWLNSECEKGWPSMVFFAGTGCSTAEDGRSAGMPRTAKVTATA